jgi:hypothetical protein
MAIKHIDVEKFKLDAYQHQGVRLPSPADYVNIIKSDLGTFAELNPSSGRLFLVEDIKIKGVETITRGQVSFDWIENTILTKWGMARGSRCDVFPEGSLQQYMRSELIERLLKEKRIRKVGKYSPQSWELDSDFIKNEIAPVMKEDLDREKRRQARDVLGTWHAYEEKPGADLPRRNSVTLEQVARYSPITSGLVVYRILKGQRLTSRCGQLYENDLFTGLMISQGHADEMLPSILQQGIAERVGEFKFSGEEWEGQKLRLVYDKNKEPEISEGWRD